MGPGFYDNHRMTTIEIELDVSVYGLGDTDETWRYIGQFHANNTNPEVTVLGWIPRDGTSESDGWWEKLKRWDEELDRMKRQVHR